MADVPSEMQAAAREFSAEELHDEKKLEKKLEQLDAGSAPAGGATAPGAAQTDAPPAGEPAAQPAAVPPAAATAKLCKAALVVADRFIVAYTTPELRLEADEIEQLVAAAVPVVEKNLPELIQKLASTPEGQFVLVAAMIYGSKLPALLAAKPAANKPNEKAAPAVPSSPPAEVKAAA